MEEASVKRLVGASGAGWPGKVSFVILMTVNKSSAARVYFRGTHVSHCHR